MCLHEAWGTAAKRTVTGQSGYYRSCLKIRMSDSDLLSK